MTSLVARQNSLSRLSYHRGATGRGGAPVLIDSTASGRGYTREPIITVSGLDEQGPQPMRMGGWSLGCQGRAVAKASAQRGGDPAAAVRARAGVMVKLAAKCLLAGESGPPAAISPAAHTGLERAPWARARPAEKAARLPTVPRRVAAPAEKRWGKRRWERRETSAAWGQERWKSGVLLALGTRPRLARAVEQCPGRV